MAVSHLSPCLKLPFSPRPVVPPCALNGLLLDPQAPSLWALDGPPLGPLWALPVGPQWALPLDAQ